MKISVCGKGGSGKSTITAGLAGCFLDLGHKVLVLDMDESNSCLHWMLGMERTPKPLMDMQEDHQSSHYHWPSSPDDLPTDCLCGEGDLRFALMGKINRAHQGCACAIGSGGRDFLGSLSLDSGEIALADMEAGVEHFGRGIGASVDATVAVVEPSLESLGLAERIRRMTIDSQAEFAGALVNKAGSPRMAWRLAADLAGRGITVLGVLLHSEEVQEAGLGGLPLRHQLLGPQMLEIAKRLLRTPRKAA